MTTGQRSEAGGSFSPLLEARIKGKMKSEAWRLGHLGAGHFVFPLIRASNKGENEVACLHLSVVVESLAAGWLAAIAGASSEAGATVSATLVLYCTVLHLSWLASLCLLGELELPKLCLLPFVRFGSAVIFANFGTFGPLDDFRPVGPT